MNKKIVSALILATLLLPILAFAQVTTCHLVVDLTDINAACTKGADVDIETYGQCCLFNSIYVMTNWLTAIIGGVVGIMIIMGAIMIVTAGGAPEKVTAGRNYILYAVIGMVVALFAKAIPSIAKAILGIG